MTFRPLYLLAVVLLASVLGAGSGQAVLIELNDPSLPASADGNNITQDTVTGLEWLDIDVSVGRTWDDLVGNDGSNEFLAGGDFEGFRYATLIEFTGQSAGPRLDSLMTSANLGVPSFSYIGGYQPVHELIQKVGCFANCPAYGYAWGALEHHTTGLETEIYIENFHSGSWDWGRSDQQVALTPFATNQGYPLQKGNWLVRPIPEPGTALLLGMGLAALGASRRRLS